MFLSPYLVLFQPDFATFAGDLLATMAPGILALFAFVVSVDLWLTYLEHRGERA